MLIKLVVTDLPVSIDLLDSEMGALKGGEFLGLGTSGNRDVAGGVGEPPIVPNPAYDTSSADPFTANAFVYADATYLRGSRPVASRGALDLTKVAYLIDTNVGLQFGSWTGSIVGAGRHQLTSASPSNDQVTGQVAAYRRGLFGITMDAIDADLQLPSVGTTVGASVTSLTAGAKLYADVVNNTGKLTGVATGNLFVGYFKGYETAPGLVKTPSAYNPANPFANLTMITLELSL
jgi:hypothetical protein